VAFAHAHIVLPSEDLGREFLDMVNELDQAGDFFGFERARTDLPAYLHMLRSEAAGLGLRPGYVPVTTFWLIDASDRLLGESRLRHLLTPELEEYGGHIGYVIRPSERRKGFGTLILAHTLMKARELGLSRVRLTCDSSNTASARIIERNGGVLSGYGISPVNGNRTSQYWIEL
jgi:predicted acetyltransferase